MRSCKGRRGSSAHRGQDDIGFPESLSSQGRYQGEPGERTPSVTFLLRSRILLEPSIGITQLEQEARGPADVVHKGWPLGAEQAEVYWPDDAPLPPSLRGLLHGSVFLVPQRLVTASRQSQLQPPALAHGRRNQL